MLRLLLLAVAVCWTAAVAQAQQAERRVALVVGNASYQHVEQLANPGNDAKLIADTLKKSGFTLVGGGAQLNLDKASFDRLVQEFGKQIQGADVALFYYAGHGMQVENSNWLVPIDANPTRQQDLDFQMINAELVLKQMDGASTRLNILILDACRNNPFANMGTRGMASGLAQMKAPDGTLISFATQPGNVAADGSGTDGPFATALSDAISKPGLDIFHLFNQVGLSVKHATQGSQEPWLSSSPIDGEFYFARAETAVDDAAVPELDAPQVAATKPAAATPVPAQAPSQPPAQAEQATRDLAEKGQAGAQIDLGLNYAKGTGVPKDYATALQWFQRAADQGDPHAEFYVGLMHERGYSVPHSYATALVWYRKAAEQNYAPAQIAVARFYARGLSVPRDREQQVVWLRRAAEQNSPLAEFILGNLYRLGIGVPREPATAAQWYQRAVAKDFGPAEGRLGLMYMHGVGVSKDYAQAMQLLRRAADKGGAIAQNGLGELYAHGDGVPRDYDQAVHWFRLSADQGNSVAAFNLGLLYADGHGVPRDPHEAGKWFQQAAAAGNQLAIAQLARMGTAVPR
jgi:TPR repeat protein